jgi:hypothetical protein
MLLILKREQIEMSKLRALAQAMVNKEKGPEAFDEFRKVAFPWVETQQKRDRAQHIKLLQDEIKRGVLGVTPLWEANKQIRSRMKTKVVEATPEMREERATRRSSIEQRKINSKLGSVIPL